MYTTEIDRSFFVFRAVGKWLYNGVSVVGFSEFFTKEDVKFAVMLSGYERGRKPEGKGSALIRR